MAWGTTAQRDHLQQLHAPQASTTISQTQHTSVLIVQQEDTVLVLEQQLPVHVRQVLTQIQAHPHAPTVNLVTSVQMKQQLQMNMMSSCAQREPTAQEQ